MQALNLDGSSAWSLEAVRDYVPAEAPNRLVPGEQSRGCAGSIMKSTWRNALDSRAAHCFLKLENSVVKVLADRVRRQAGFSYSLPPSLRVIPRGDVDVAGRALRLAGLPLRWDDLFGLALFAGERG